MMNHFCNLLFVLAIFTRNETKRIETKRNEMGNMCYSLILEKSRFFKRNPHQSQHIHDHQNSCIIYSTF